MSRIKICVEVFLVFLMMVAISACGKIPNVAENSNPSDRANLKNSVSLTVSAASSLKDVMNDIKQAYEKEAKDVKITYNFGSSGSLQQQIENGADVDLFISAGKKQMDALKTKGLLEDGTVKNLLGNSLVLIVPKDSSLSVGFEELGQDKVKKLAIGEPSTTPAGQYAEQVLEKYNILDKVKQKTVYAKDVKEVLTWVETGNADAGIVYETDARVSQKVKKVAEAPAGSYKPIVYPAAVIKSSKNIDQAKAFLQFLSSEKAEKYFEKYGFKFIAK